jgi:hypothetical protein
MAAIVAHAERICGPEASQVLTAAIKSDGSPNFNHTAFLALAPERTRCGIAWRRDHPGDWLAHAAGFYAMWTRPTFVHPYEPNQIIGPFVGSYHRYARAYERVFFLDLRPFVEARFPGLFLHAQALDRKRRPVPYTLAGFVIFPAIAAIVVALLAVRPWRQPEALAAVALLCWLWPMIGACLTDGWEGNRMRFSTGPAFLIMAGFAFRSLVRMVRRNR